MFLEKWAVYDGLFTNSSYGNFWNDGLSSTFQIFVDSPLIKLCMWFSFSSLEVLHCTIQKLSLNFFSPSSW